MRYYTATKSRNQGRDAWSVIFRHPVRLDVSTNKPGRRVRRGLGTADEVEAAALIDELNEILRTPSLWEPAARVGAAARFDSRVVDIFYDGLEATQVDFSAVRDQLLPLPGAEQGYRTVLLLGTTGAGKTTVVRQILGTGKRSERFPSTSTAKTTVADTELIPTEDPVFRAAVTFVPRDEVIDYLTENVSAAAVSALKGKNDRVLTRTLLDHVGQRYRFSYVLGRSVDEETDDLVDEDETETDDVDPTEYGAVDLAATMQVVQRAVQAIRVVAERHADVIRQEVEPDETDERVISEYIEENLDTVLRESDEYHEIVDALIDEIEKRFTSVAVGELRRNRQGWPLSWTWTTTERRDFLRVLAQFTSNYAPLFGRLLTPLVNGIRVSGPFTPAWGGPSAKLVLIDGEGLGHTPKSAAALSTHVTEQLLKADAVLLVDNAIQPMQAAPVAALKSIAVSGDAAKLHLVFTHFDQVRGPNLPSFQAREEHVLASVENVLKSIGEDLGPAAERALRRRLDRARFFVGAIQTPLEATVGTKIGQRSIQQFENLLAVLAHPELAVDAGNSRPVFDRMNLSLAVAEATKEFHARWRGLLGLETNTDSPKAHWTRVKALSRRLAEGWADGYEDLQPVANLRYELQRQIYLLLQRPLRWEGGIPSEDERQAIIDDLANAVTTELIEFTRRRLKDDVRLGWQAAFAQRGPGSTFIRARMISSDVLDRGAPIPTVSASPDQNRFLKDVAAIVTTAGQERNVVLE
ncbi:hypothetical protein [Actinoplanes utahensis]|uniref:hypothetical protein n=1 Tax=Actinoplanes utahensis TaxID=1869 RepID=UPI0009FBB1D6|nr:hypothetical protein [Actinoplanes utahensis]GIF35402.1 hypothetical protein Aut01nite_83880 [Actinoplanes utahensis]